MAPITGRGNPQYFGVIFLLIMAPSSQSVEPPQNPGRFSCDRGVAPGIQRGAAEEIARRADAICIRQATGRQIGYINPRTLKPSATEKRGDVAIGGCDSLTANSHQTGISFAFRSREDTTQHASHIQLQESLRMVADSAGGFSHGGWQLPDQFGVLVDCLGHWRHDSPWDRGAHDRHLG